jgi:hypothetical protein
MSEIMPLMIYILGIIVNLNLASDYLERKGHNYAASDLLYLMLNEIQEIEKYLPETLHR